jgi:hypothetical protein
LLGITPSLGRIFFLKSFQAKVSEVIEEICGPWDWSNSIGGGSPEKTAGELLQNTPTTRRVVKKGRSLNRIQEWKWKPNEERERKEEEEVL